MNYPLVSIVITCYNRAHLLPQTLESVSAQKYKPVEIIVIDDGSTDKTRDLIAGYGNQVQYFWQENQGIAATRTTGGRLAKGELIAFQDDDDLMTPDRIVDLYEAMLQYPNAILATGDWAAIDINGKLTGERLLPANADNQETAIIFNDGYSSVLWPEIPATTPNTTLFRKADGDRIGWFDKRLKNAAEDKDFFARIGQLGPIVYIPKVVSYYRRGHESLYRPRNIQFLYYQFLMLEKHLMTLPPGKVKLRARLQDRMQTNLIRMTLCRRQGQELPEAASWDISKRGLALLTWKNRLHYVWNILIKQPLRKYMPDRNHGMDLMNQ